jgi:hypothetical protein
MKMDYAAELRNTLATSISAHLPSKHSFFSDLKQTKPTPEILGKLHLIYQTAMHATRVGVYHLPHLDSPSLRKRKIVILMDDDHLPNGDTHHYQLTRTFKNIGAEILLDDESFGDLDGLWLPDWLHSSLNMTIFLNSVYDNYTSNLGGWVYVEAVSNDWMIALRDSLMVHFPQIEHEPYFADCFNANVEDRHASESLNLTLELVKNQHQIYTNAVYGIRHLAQTLNGIWDLMDDVILGVI